jgi:hypothetical protein
VRKVGVGSDCSQSSMRACVDLMLQRLLQQRQTHARAHRHTTHTHTHTHTHTDTQPAPLPHPGLPAPPRCSLRLGRGCVGVRGGERAQAE